MIQLRRLTTLGVDEFRRRLRMEKQGEDSHLEELQTSAQWSVLVSDEEVLDETAQFSTRHAAAKYLYEVLTKSLTTSDDIPRDVGLWSWLSVVYRDQVAPWDEKTETRLWGDEPRYVPEVDDWRRYYRHLLAGPYYIYSAHAEAPDNAAALLATQLHRPGDVVENFASRQQIVTNPEILWVIRHLYYDSTTGALKRGSGRKDLGGARRLVRVLDQFDLTFDVYGLPKNKLLDLLPSEFDEFRKSA